VRRGTNASRLASVPVVPAAERFEPLEETLQICLQMWSENNGSFDGRHYQFAETLCDPASISRPIHRSWSAMVARRHGCWWLATPSTPALGVTEVQTMPDRHPVEFAEQIAERVLPRLAQVG